MKVYSNVTGTAASSSAKIVKTSALVITWNGMTGGSFTPQWSKDGGTTWVDYAIGSQSAAAGKIEAQVEAPGLIRLNGTSITGGIYAYIDGDFVIDPSA